MYDLICIGASWGGLQAVGRVLSDLPPPDVAAADARIGASPELRPYATEGREGLARLTMEGR